MGTKQCDQPDRDSPRYRCSSTAMEDYDQCLYHHKNYIDSLKEENEKLKWMVDNGLGWEDMKNDVRYPID